MSADSKMRHLPTAEQHEQALIGAMLKDPECREQALSFVTPEHFSSGRNQAIVRAFGVIGQGEYLELLAELERAGFIKGNGDFEKTNEYLAGIIQDTATSTGVKHYAEKIGEAAFRREMLKTSEELASGARNLRLDVGDIARQGIEALKSISEQERDSKPTDLARQVPPAPEFPLHVFPAAVRDYVTDIAHRLQCSADMVGIPGIIELAGLVGKEVVIRPKAYDTEWEERACLWALIASEKSTMKSAGLQAGTKNLRRIQKMFAEEDKDVRKKWATKNAEFLVRKKFFNKKCASTLRKDPGAQLPKMPEELADPPEEPESRRLIINDTTVEKLADLMEASRGLTLVRDELSGFMVNMGRYNNGSDRQFYLECYSGGSHHIDRISRGEQYIGDLYLNIAGGIQPKVARTIFSGEAVDDGFFERFGLIAYPEKKQGWELVDRKPDKDARENMVSLCNMLAFSEWSELLPIDSTPAGEEYGKPHVKFSDHAQAIFDGWLKGHMEEVNSMAEDDPMSGFIGKQRGLLVRLCLIFHLASWAGGDEVDIKHVSDKTLNDVLILFSDYIRPMWERIVAAFGQTRTDEGARKIADWILAGKTNRVSLRDIQRKQWTGMQTNKEILSAVGILISHKWLSEEATMPSGPKGGRGWKGWIVNPLVLE